MLVPEGDWHCPPCQHSVLVKRLQETLKAYDRDQKRRENEELRRKRLAYIGISLDNVLPGGGHQPREKRDRESGSESSGSSDSESGSGSEDSDEPVYQLRQRRQGATSYRFNEYDDLINSAIQDGVHDVNSAVVGAAEKPDLQTVPEGHTEEEGKGTPGNTVDLNGEANIPEKAKPAEKPKKKEKTESGDESSESDEEEDEEEEEFPSVVPKRNNVLPRPGKKKHRRLNCLDDPSDDDDGSDEDFKGSSSEEEEEEDEEYSDDSDIGRRGRSKRGHLVPVRRSSRARRSRIDKEFINDDSDESDAPRRKKKKKLWSDSDSESDDSTWGKRKKKKTFNSSGRRKLKKNKKFSIEDELSDVERSKTPKQKRQRKIKYGGLDDLAVEELPTRRTRGRKMNYVEVGASDSDEGVQKKKGSKKAVIEDDEDEFVAEKEDEKEDSDASADDDDNFEEEEEEEERSSGEEEEIKEVQKSQEENKTKVQNPKPETPTSPPAITSPIKIPQPAIVSPPKVVNKDKPPAGGRRGRPPKAMIAPPPERLISEDEQYKAIVSKVSTLEHGGPVSNLKHEVNVMKPLGMLDQTNSSQGCFGDSVHQLTPIKVPNSSYDPKLVHRSPPIKIRSGVAVNAGGRRSPTLASPNSDNQFFPKSPNTAMINSPPDRSQFFPQIQRTNAAQLKLQQASRNPVNLLNVKSEIGCDENEDDLDEEDYMDDIEEEEEDDSEDDVLEEGEIPKKVARRMAREEERMQRLEEKKLKEIKSVQGGALNVQPMTAGAVQPTNDQKPPTTQPSQPLLRVVSPLKLMANPPGPLQSTFMHSGMGPRMSLNSGPPPARMGMAMRPPQPTNMMPGMGVDDGSPGKRRGRGRGKKQTTTEKLEQEMMSGGSVIRGMLQQPQSYPPSHYPQQFPPHPRIPFNPQRMPRPPFHPGQHHPLDPSPSGGGPVGVKQEPGGHPPSNPVNIPNKPPPHSSAPPYHAPPHRFDPGIPPRQPNYPPQVNPPPKAPYGSYPPPAAPSGNYHYGSYPPPMTPREEPPVYPVPQQFSEPYQDQSVAAPPPSAPPTSTANPTSKGFSEEDSGEFGGLVSYFSSQREDNIDT